MAGHGGRIRAALVDVGGTLWPDQWPSPPDELAQRRDRLRRAFPGLSPEDAIEVLTALERAGSGLDAQVAQDLGGYAGGTLRRFGLGDGAGEIAAVLRAMCIPAVLRIRLFPGAREHPKAVPMSGEQRDPDLTDLRFLKSQAQCGWPASQIPCVVSLVIV
jgi:hypothetical protein